MSRKPRLFILSAAGTVSLIIGSTQMAGAATYFPTSPSVSHISGLSVSRLTTGSGVQAAVLGSPISGCYGQTDRPHYSTHVGGTVNVIARTVCPPLGVYVSIDLTRDRWYGEQDLSSNQNSGVNSVQTNTAWDCAGVGTYTYHGYGYHEASDGSYAYTSNSSRFNC